MMDPEPTSEKIVFKKKGKKNLRQRKTSEDEDDEQDVLSKIEEMKEIQRLRERSKGVSIAGLAVGRKLALEEEILSKDPFKIGTGGLVNMQNLKSGKAKPVDDAYDTSIGTQFSAETNKRDEDEEMMKYIEEELKKRKGQDSAEDGNADSTNMKYMTPEEAALFALPSHLRQGNAIRSEEMLSNQMLCGIPEVDLGIESKIKNIEATEEAKQKLIDEQNKKKDGPSVFVPTNYAVNFTQHNRFNIESGIPEKKVKREDFKQKPNTENTGGAKKATDDYHFDKFRKQFRKH